MLAYCRALRGRGRRGGRRREGWFYFCQKWGRDGGGEGLGGRGNTLLRSIKRDSEIEIVQR